MLDLSDVAYPTRLTLDGAFLEVAALQPERTAVTFGDRSSTYGQLEVRSAEIASALVALGVEPGDSVAVHCNRGTELVALTLGIMRAGAAYVPLDPANPVDRNCYVIDDCGAQLVVVDDNDTAQLLPGNHVHVEDLKGDPTVCAQSRSTVEAVAYVIYTSGTTGRPKGVMVEHSSIVRLFRNDAPFVSFDADDVWCLFHSNVFDFSLWEMFGCLLSGGRLVVVPKDVAVDTPRFLDLVRSERVTVLNQTPAAFHALSSVVEHVDERALTVRIVLLGGESLATRQLLPWATRFPATKFVNMYGVTETSIVSTAKVLDPTRFADSVNNIGTPIPTLRAEVVDDGLQAVEPGGRGELLIGGAGVARGYVGRPELTAEKFIDVEGKGRFYRTGDLVRLLESGDLEYLGRIDTQVQVRGHRVELSEIEHVLSEYADVDAAVVVPQVDDSTTTLRAFVVGDGGLDLETLDRRLRERLPAYMVPSSITSIESIPLTISGKIDHRGLLASFAARPADVTPLETDTERAVARLWSEVLNVDVSDAGASFFALGGDSLRAVRVQMLSGGALRLVDIFDSPTLRDLARKWRGEVSASSSVKMTGRNPGPTAPLAYQQEQVWFLQQLDPSNKAYHFQSGFRIYGPLDIDVFRAALAELLVRHDAFRTEFRSENGEPVQVVIDAVEVPLRVEDLRQVAAGDQDEALEAIVKEEMGKSFDLEHAPLVRWIVTRLDDETAVFTHIEHHLLHDGWSWRLLLSDLFDIYTAMTEGRSVDVVAGPTMRDFGAWQREWLGSADADRQVDYWRKALSDAPAVMPLPWDHPRPAVQTFKGAAPRFEVSAQTTRRLSEVAAESGTTLFMTMLAGFYSVLRRYSGSDDLVVGSSVAARTHAETEGLVAMIVNALPLRLDLSGEPSFREVLRRLREMSLDAYANQDYPFELLVQQLRPVTDLSHSPLFQVMFSFHDSAMTGRLPDGLTTELFEGMANGSAKFDMNLIGIPHIDTPSCKSEGEPGGVTIIWEYNSDLFAGETVQRLAADYFALLDQACADLDARITELPMAAENQVALPGPVEDFPLDRSLPSLISEIACRNPLAVAAQMNDVEVTYAELDAASDFVAANLLRSGVEEEKSVCVLGRRNIDMLTAILGIWKAGGVYVPLDPAHPVDRLSAIVNSCEPAVIVCDSEYQALAEDLGAECGARALPHHVVGRRSEPMALPVLHPRQLAYIIFTSGSTGAPKGVMVEHSGMVNHLYLKVTDLDMRPSDCMIQNAPQSFDISIWQFFAPLLAGARVHIVTEEEAQDPDRMLTVVSETEATVLEVVPAVLREMLVIVRDLGDKVSLSTLRWMVVTGEAWTQGMAAAWLESFPGIPLLNAYGPTECSDDVTHHVMDGVDLPMLAARPDSVAPIGTTVANHTLHIVDPGTESLVSVPSGVHGELLVEGAGVGRGYLNDPRKTAETFVPNPFSDVPGSRLYRTGDAVRTDDNGVIEFIGRLDHQVKLRGFRIELGEIEATVERLAQVHQAACVVTSDGAGNDHLVAYFSPAGSSDDCSAAVRAALAKKLPEYMVPSVFVQLDDLPVTRAGKLDRAALPVPRFDDASVVKVAPVTPEEKLVASIYEDVLGIDGVAANDDLFSLGGHSLLATRVLARLRRDHGVDMPLRTVFESPKVSDLALAVIEYSHK